MDPPWFLKLSPASGARPENAQQAFALEGIDRSRRVNFFRSPDRQARNATGGAMSRTTLRRLEVFVGVVEAGGFRACADHLHISPAAVSHQVAQLEAVLGCRLFTRL